MNQFLSSMLNALKPSQAETAEADSDRSATGRIGMRVLAFAVFAALLGLAPNAQAQDRGDRNPNRGCDRDRGPDRGCPIPPGPPREAPPPPR
jgi:hypothetical protein